MNATAKISENILDMVITIATVGILLAYLNITQPAAAVEYGGYIIAIYLVILLRRIVHDFDDTYQIHEIGSKVETLRSVVFDLYRSSSNDNAHLTDDEIDERFSSMQ